MKLATRVFRREDWYVTSNFGNRYHPITGTYSWHNGTDYGTYGNKWPQYAVENGTVETAGRDGQGGIFAWVKYPRIGIRMLHYHLDSLNVKSGQEVNKDTIIGYTGTTGQSTGIHLHMSITKIGSNDRFNPHTFEYTEAIVVTKTNEELAKEVIDGKWGNGADRKARLTAAGYDYSKVQAIVNEMVKPITKPLKVGERVVPIKLITYDGKPVKQYDKDYIISEIVRDRVVLKTYRGGKLITWAAMNINNLRRI